MLKHKKVSVKKICPGCGLQYPVAVKTCNKCNHSFYLSKKDVLPPKPAGHAPTAAPADCKPKDPASILAAPTRSDGRRRTERVRREKPNYYDASAFIRKTKKRTEKAGSKHKDDFQGCCTVQLTRPKKGAVSQKQNYKTRVIQDPEDKIYHTIMNNEKAKVCSIILAGLNDKLMLTSWRP